MNRTRHQQSPYVRVEHVQNEQHPVDVAIARLLPQRSLRRRILCNTDRLLAALGEQRTLWLEIEELIAEYSSKREEAYFNLGYQHGIAAARAVALRATSKTGVGNAQRAFADRIRELTIQAGLPLPLTMAPLLEAAWTIALGLSDEPTTTHGRRRR